jgi:hypothetical protein
LLAGLQPALIGGVAGLDDELVVARHLQPGAEDVAHVDELQHLGVSVCAPSDMRSLLYSTRSGRIETLRALADLRDVDGLGVEHLAIVELHDAAMSSS